MAKVGEFVDTLKFSNNRGAAQKVFRRKIERGLRREMG
jgi:hypothetical protein